MSYLFLERRSDAVTTTAAASPGSRSYAQITSLDSANMRGKSNGSSALPLQAPTTSLRCRTGSFVVTSLCRNDNYAPVEASRTKMCYEPPVTSANNQLLTDILNFFKRLCSTARGMKILFVRAEKIILVTSVVFSLFDAAFKSNRRTETGCFQLKHIHLYLVWSVPLG